MHFIWISYGSKSRNPFIHLLQVPLFFFLFFFQNNTDFLFYSLVKAQLCKLIINTSEECDVCIMQNRFTFLAATRCFTRLRDSEKSWQNRTDFPMLCEIECSVPLYKTSPSARCLQESFINPPSRKRSSMRSVLVITSHLLLGLLISYLLYIILSTCPAHHSIWDCHCNLWNLQDQISLSNMTELLR